MSFKNSKRVLNGPKLLQEPFQSHFEPERKEKLHIIGTSTGGISYEKSIKGENLKRYQKKHWDIHKTFDFDHYIRQ